MHFAIGVNAFVEFGFDIQKICDVLQLSKSSHNSVFVKFDNLPLETIVEVFSDGLLKMKINNITEIVVHSNIQQIAKMFMQNLIDKELGFDYQNIKVETNFKLCTQGYLGFQIDLAQVKECSNEKYEYVKDTNTLYWNSKLHNSQYSVSHLGQVLMESSCQSYHRDIFLGRAASMRQGFKELLQHL